MTNPLPPVPNQSITANSTLTPQWLAWFNQLYVFVTAGQQGGGGLVPGSTAIATTAPVEGGGAIASGLTLSLEQSGVTNGFLAQMQPDSLKGNASPSAAQPQDLGPGAVKSLLNIEFTDVSGELQESQFPGLTGVVSAAPGSTVTTLSPAPADTIFGNNTNATAVPTNLTVAQVQALLSIITNQTQIGNLLYPQTQAEIFANVTPTNTIYPPGNALRFAVDPTGTVDSTVAIQNWIDATWAMYHYQDAQGLWNGGGGAAPVLVLPPGKYMVSNTMYLPTGVTFKGTGHPANTVSHTRIVLNSTGQAPARTWTAGATIGLDWHINPGTGLGTYYFQAITPGVTGSSPPNWLSAQSAGATIGDGTVVWQANLPMTAGDNRNNPMFKFRRGTLPPSLGNGVLQNSACTTAIQELEFWCVTLGSSTFSNPLVGIGLGLGDYPNGGIFSFDVDADDFRFKDCVFQHSPAAIRGVGISGATNVRGDGFTGNRGLGIFFENCEFDASAAHVYLQSCLCDLYFEDCEFFGGVHRYELGSGNVRYQGGDMSGGAYIDAVSVSNAFGKFYVKGVTMSPPSGFSFPQVGLDLTLGVSAVTARLVDISENTFDSAAVIGGITVNCANGGRICGNSLNDQGFNASAGTNVNDFIATIKLGGCQNLLISENNITATDSASYNGFGILTWTTGSATSQNNLITNNSVTAPYNGSTFNGQDRQINLATGDIRGINFDPNRSTTAMYSGPIVSSGCLTSFGAPPTVQSPGWGTPTGTVGVANFPGASATLTQCSGVIAIIIDELKGLGYFSS